MPDRLGPSDMLRHGPGNDLLLRMLDKDDASRDPPIVGASIASYHNRFIVAHGWTSRGPDATQCLEHPWFSAYSEAPMLAPLFRVCDKHDLLEIALLGTGSANSFRRRSSMREDLSVSARIFQKRSTRSSRGIGMIPIWRLSVSSALWRTSQSFAGPQVESYARMPELRKAGHRTLEVSGSQSRMELHRSVIREGIFLLLAHQYEVQKAAWGPARAVAGSDCNGF